MKFSKPYHSACKPRAEKRQIAGRRAGISPVPTISRCAGCSGSLTPAANRLFAQPVSTPNTASRSGGASWQ